MIKGLFSASLAMFLAIFGSAPLFGQSAPYFQGKTILLIQGREPGGTGTVHADALTFVLACFTDHDSRITSHASNYECRTPAV